MKLFAKRQDKITSELRFLNFLYYHLLRIYYGNKIFKQVFGKERYYRTHILFMRLKNVPIKGNDIHS